MPSLEQSVVTDATLLRLLDRATSAINRAVDLHGVWCTCPGCQLVYRRWAERHAEAERRGLDWRSP